MIGEARLLFSMALLHLAVAVIYMKLQPGERLGKGDEIVSTLGLFKVVLQESDCSLSLYRFSQKNQSYSPTNRRYTGNNAIGQCNYLQIIDHRVASNNLVTFLELASSNLSIIYLIIDDNAVVRLIGIKASSGNPNPFDYDQITLSNYTQTNSQIAVLDSYGLVADKLSAASNSNNWMFQLSTEVLTITNPLLQASFAFPLPRAYFSIAGIFDINNDTLPSASFDGMIYRTGCSGQKSGLYGPFVLEVDQYWPRVAVYDQQKYKVFEYSGISGEDHSNPCPRFTFNLNDQCVTFCPSPYFHQVDLQHGKCVLSCQYGSTIDIANRFCSCANKIQYQRVGYNCINSNSYYFGCFCQDSTYFHPKSYSCVTNCPQNTLSYLGICLSCSQGCTKCSTNSNGLTIHTCTQCFQGYTLSSGVCTYQASCTPFCLYCINQACMACQPFYTLFNGLCLESCLSGQVTTISNLTSTCTATVPVVKCSVECLKCAEDSSCLICQPGFSLLVSPISITCRKKSLHYTCKSNLYAASPNSNVCYSNDSSSLTLLSTCLINIPNCILCHFSIYSTCLLCKDKFFLQQNRCLSSCSSTYTIVNQGCIPMITNCILNTFLEGKYEQFLTYETVSNNFQYSSFINNGTSSSNQPYGYTLYIQHAFKLATQLTSTNARFMWKKQICAQCKNGYGLTGDYSSCMPCPKGCLLCLHTDVCVATTHAQLLAFTLGKTVLSCANFIGEDSSCILSCPSETLPTFNDTLSKLICLSPSLTSAKGYLRVDGSTYSMPKNTYIHRFVFDSSISLKSSRLLQQSNLQIDASGNSITFQSSQPSQLLNLTGLLPNLLAANGQYPANSVYGVNAETSFRSYIRKWLAGVGYVLSVMLMVMQCVYVGNGVLYKMDNILIFAQSLFYFLFRQLLLANPLAQYYYGFSWAHLGFYPNYFDPELNISEPTIPPYALYNLDANIIRNCGNSLSALLTFGLLWGVASTAIYIAKKKFGRAIWYWRICRDSAIGAIEFFSYNIFYWCIAFINHDKNYSTSGTFIGLTVLLLTILIVYTLARLYFHPLAGLYMLKRLFYASVLASSYQRTSFLAILIIVQLLFAVGRSFIERPREKWLLVSLWLEEGFIIVFLVILYTSTNASVVSILTSVFIYAWLLTFVADLVDLYFTAKNKEYQVGCFKSLFEEEKAEVCRSSQDEKGQTDRPINSNFKAN